MIIILDNILPYRFEIAIFVLIFLNMLTMGIEHYGQPHGVFFVLEVSNAFFTTVFGLGRVSKQYRALGAPVALLNCRPRLITRSKCAVYSPFFQRPL